MKAVDPVTINDSFPSGNVILSNTMVPKVDTSNSISNGESVKSIGKVNVTNSSALKSSLNNSPTKDSPAKAVNGCLNGSDGKEQNGLENIGTQVKTNGLLSNGCITVTRSYSPRNGFNYTTVDCDKTSDFQHDVGDYLFHKENDSYISVSSVNGVVNGYCKGEEDNSNEKHSLESLTDVEVDDSKRCSSPPENIPRMEGYSGLAVDSGLESAASSWDRAVVEARESAVARLQDELRGAQEQLKLKDEEVVRLSRIRQEVESELEELTASLFQEAHNMVRDARERQAAAEKTLHERGLQIEVLTAEVAALKTLVLTSTPSRPNPHLHPQIDPKAKDDGSNTGNPLFRKHRRSPSHFNLKYGRENSPPDSPTKDCLSKPQTPPSEPVELRDGYEVDPVMHSEFLAWKENPTTEQTDPFIARIYQEDIDSCLSFSNTELAAQVLAAVKSGNIFIEAVNEKSKTHFPKKCALLEAPRLCQYRMRLGEDDTWHSISQICRNRIIAVCDFLNYLNYIQRGLVKSSVSDVYWEVVRLRKEMVLARLGLPLSSSC